MEGELARMGELTEPSLHAPGFMFKIFAAYFYGPKFQVYCYAYFKI
jgi:hypothetical protein